MATEAAAGESTSRDSEEAGREATRAAPDALGGALDVLIVSATAHDQRASRDAILGASVCGRSGAGIQADCTGRARSLIGASVTERCIAPAQATFRASVPWLGSHSSGEIGPVGGPARLHDDTLALCAAYDGAAP